MFSGPLAVLQANYAARALSLMDSGDLRSSPGVTMALNIKDSEVLGASPNITGTLRHSGIESQRL
jgi:hypothetical protein